MAAGQATWVAGLVLGLMLAACGDATPRITSRTGEVHLHQYPAGAHLEALFVDPATPIEQTEYDSTLPSRNPALLEVGECKVYGFGPCAGACPSPVLVDGGRVEIDGLPRAISLGYQPQFGSYEDVVVEDGGFLVAGVLARVRGLGGGTIPPFSAEIALPVPILPTSTLPSGLSAGLEVGWSAAGDGSQVKILVNVVPESGVSGAVSCYVDEALGRFRVPDQALALLAPPPRTVQLEVSRYRLVEVSLGDGRSVVLHSGSSVLSATMEP